MDFLSFRSSTRFLASRIDRQWLFCLGGVGVLAAAMAMAMAWYHTPTPMIHDEFSHLLVADTLLAGRLANPSPEIWQPFQSFHILVNPSYASKYPLGPGGLLALGILLFGSPAAGIWIGAASGTASITWACAACMPRRWAVIVGILLAIHPNVHHEWSLSFMNGWLTATAGALVFGAVLRLRKQVRIRDGVLLGIGAGLLALCRPMEGLVFTMTSAGLLLFCWRGLQWPDRFRRASKTAAYASGPIMAAFLLIAMHNYATTGRITQMAYQLHESKYGVAPLSIFQKQKDPEMSQWSAEVPPTFMAFHYGWSLESYHARSHLLGWCAGIPERLHVVVKLWGALFCLIVVGFLMRRARVYLPMVACVFVALAVSTFVPWYFSHYFAPSLVVIAILFGVALRSTLQSFVRPTQLRLAVTVVVLIQGFFACDEISRANQRAYTWADQRQWLVDDLTKAGGKHLILVRYHADHNVHQEWVYNAADLSKSTVLWTRSWRPDLDQRLIQHHTDRQVWILEFDESDKPALSPFSGNAPKSVSIRERPQHLAADTIH